jgi:hypothetical protein
LAHNAQLVLVSPPPPAFNANANVDPLVDALETVGRIVVHVDLG